MSRKPSPQSQKYAITPRRDFLSDQEIREMEKRRQERKAKNHTVNPYRY